MAQQIEASKSVHVANISPKANEKTVSDFFSFCGKISKLFLNTSNPEVSSAVVQFDTESAAKTALLLTNALIVDRPIVVVPYTETPVATAPPLETASQVDATNITQKDFGGVPDENRSKTSAVASLLAAGYCLASDALDKAKEYDDKHNISLQAKVAIEQVKVKAHEIDQQYHISEKATAIKTTTVEKAKKIDESYGISTTATKAAQSVTATAAAAAAKVQQNPTVASTIEAVKSSYNTASESVTAAFNDYKQEVAKEIEKKKEATAKVGVSGTPAQQPPEQQQQSPLQQPLQPTPAPNHPVQEEHWWTEHLII